MAPSGPLGSSRKFEKFHLFGVSRWDHCYGNIIVQIYEGIWCRKHRPGPKTAVIITYSASWIRIFVSFGRSWITKVNRFAYVSKHSCFGNHWKTIGFIRKTSSCRFVVSEDMVVEIVDDVWWIAVGKHANSGSPSCQSIICTSTLSPKP